MAPSAGRYLFKNADDPLDDADTSDEKLDEHLLRGYISEIIRKCGDDWCLYTKGKDRKTGRRRRLGKHPSKAGAARQERAIKMHGG